MKKPTSRVPFSTAVTEAISKRIMALRDKGWTVAAIFILGVATAEKTKFIKVKPNA